MRFEDGSINCFVSGDKCITEQEKDYLIREYQRRGVDMLKVGAKALKNEISGSDLENVYENEEQRELFERAQASVQQKQEQPQAGGAAAAKPKKKGKGLVLLIVFFVVLAVVIVSATNGNYIVAVGAFMAAFAFFGFFSVITGNKGGSTGATLKK